MGKQISLYAGEDLKALMAKVPVGVSVSTMMRCIVMALTLSKKEYQQALKNDRRLYDARNHLREILFEEEKK